MSKPVNPIAIGGFLIGGITLLITALLVFGGGQFFTPKIRLVVYFDTSLNGLNIGAPVKVQGVQVGVVKEIELQLDRHQQRLWKPVVLEIEPWRMATPDGVPYQLPLLVGKDHGGELKRLIDAGLRARLESQSILTGLLYVDLDFFPDKPPRLTGLNYKGMPEIPSVPPTVDEVITTLEDVVKKIRTIPFETIVGDLAGTLSDIRKLVDSDETRKSQAAMTRALINAQDLMAKLDNQLPALVRNMDQTMGNLSQASKDISSTARETTTTVREIQGRAAPVMKAAESTLVQATETLGSAKKATDNLALKATDTLDSAKKATDNIADSTASDSSLQDSVVELRKAAQSLRELTDYLQRHPDSILYGRSE
jgi:paraquat-inducible protein B